MNKKQIVYKLILFGIALTFGAIFSYGNWILGLIIGLIILSSYETQKAYEKGRHDGYQEALKRYDLD